MIEDGLQQKVYDAMDEVHKANELLDQLREKKAGIVQAIEDSSSLFDVVDKDWLRRASYALKMTKASIMSANNARSLSLTDLSVKREELRRSEHLDSQMAGKLEFTRKVRDYMGIDAYNAMNEVIYP